MLTKAEWEKIRGPWRIYTDGRPPFSVMGLDLDEWVATLDALFEYRERTRGYYNRAPKKVHVKKTESLLEALDRQIPLDADDIAKELGLE